MKIALITDQHFGVRKGHKLYFDYYKKFYTDVFFPELKKRNISIVIDLGDTFDNRKSIDFLSLAKSKEMFYEPIKNMGIKIHMLVGNHTAFYKNTNEINTPELLLKEYQNIVTYREVTDIELDGLQITMLPWINSENEKKVMHHIGQSKAKVLFGHLELNGFVAHAGHTFEGGLDRAIFSKYRKVFSGHFHHKSTQENVTYLGNPYQLYWNDYGESRGFHIFDTKTGELEFIKNPYSIFIKLYYNDSNEDYSNYDFSYFKDCYVKVYVQQKSDSYTFDKVIQNLYDVGAHEIKVIEDTYSPEEEDGNIETEDTLSLLQSYLDEVNYNDISSVKNTIKNLYLEALEII
jgi:Calcineurin-like phosphoesterase